MGTKPPGQEQAAIMAPTLAKLNANATPAAVVLKLRSPCALPWPQAPPCRRAPASSSVTGSPALKQPLTRRRTSHPLDRSIDRETYLWENIFCESCQKRRCFGCLPNTSSKDLS